MGTYEVRLESVVSVWLVLGNLLVQFGSLEGYIGIDLRVCS